MVQQVPAPGQRNGARTRRGASLGYSFQEINYLLYILQRIVLINEEEWEEEVKHHAQYPQRTWKTSRRGSSKILQRSIIDDGHSSEMEYFMEDATIVIK